MKQTALPTLRLACAAVLLAACSQGPAIDAGIDAPLVDAARVEEDAECHAARASCQLGLFFGHCGAETSERFLACSEATGTCVWFSSAECPEGWRRSRCPPTDVCCHDTPEGPWPFEDPVPTSPMAIVEMALDLAAMGPSAIDAETPTEIAVTVDDTLVPPAELAVSCTEGAPLAICTSSLRSLWTHATGLSRVLELIEGNLVGERVLVELLDAAPTRARAFVRRYTDAAPPWAARACTPPTPRPLEGTLRLAGTSDLHGELELTFAGGEWARFAF